VADLKPTFALAGVLPGATVLGGCSGALLFAAVDSKTSCLANSDAIAGAGNGCAAHKQTRRGGCNCQRLALVVRPNCLTNKMRHARWKFHGFDAQRFFKLILNRPDKVTGRDRRRCKIRSAAVPSREWLGRPDRLSYAGSRLGTRTRSFSHRPAAVYGACQSTLFRRFSGKY
jgi:hypothetical protein